MRSHSLKTLFVPAVLSLVCAFVLAPALATPAAAGVHYEAVTTAEGQQGKPQTIRVEAWIEGPNAKILFTESNNPVAGSGNYMLTRDAGKTLLMVNPEEKTYSTWDLDAMMEGIGNLMQSMGPILNLKIDNIHVESLLEEPGGSLLGLSTTHYRYRTSYDMTIKVLGMGRSNAVEQLQDIWATDQLADAAIGVWLRKAPATGNPELDELMRAEMSKTKGFPLKMVQVSTTTDKKGRSNESRTTTEVTTLERGVAIPGGTFEIPTGYKETEMVIPGATGAEGDDGKGGKGGNPFKKIFGGG